MKNRFLLFLITLGAVWGCADESNEIVLPSSEESIAVESTNGDVANTPTAFENEVFDLINNHRTEKGLQPFTFSMVVYEEAKSHSENMANGSVPFSHQGFSERVDRIAANIPVWGAAENVAYGYRSASSVVNGWLRSSGHRRNIEGNYSVAAIGIAYDGGTPYYTQLFIRN